MRIGGGINQIAVLAEKGDRRAIADMESLNIEVDNLTWEGFKDLSLSRSYGMSGPLPITLSEIFAWFEICEIKNISQRIRLMKRFRYMDAHWLEYVIKYGT